MNFGVIRWVMFASGCALVAGFAVAETGRDDPAQPGDQHESSAVSPIWLELSTMHREEPVPPPTEPFPPSERGSGLGAEPVVRGRFTSVQVNTDAFGDNITRDAANEPSIAIDPTDPNKIVIGWRQFDTIFNSFRQAGVAYSHDGGETWTFPGVLDPGQFRSDPVLAADADGVFYYYSLSTLTSIEMFISRDGGLTWEDPVYGFGGDKEWMTVDRTDGEGRGNIYAFWNLRYSCCPGDFTRSVDGGQSFEEPVNMPQRPIWGTLTVDPTGSLYIVGIGQLGFVVIRSYFAKDADITPVVFDQVVNFNLGGHIRAGTGPNPQGLLGQMWIDSDHSDGPTRGNLYVLASVDPPGDDPLDVMFVRSTDGGVYWSDPVRVNDDPVDNGAWQWFGTMSVAPNGRIDVVFNDTRNYPDGVFLSELYYTSSTDAGQTWRENVPVTPVFDSSLGWPRQNKLGDYYHMISDNRGANLAYAATFNGEQDVYFVRIDADCNGNGANDDEDIAEGRSEDCNGNEIPDECDIDMGTSEDCSGNGIPDECEADSDKDGVVDSCDNCVDIANTDQADGDSDGKGDLCDPCPLDHPDDFDGDGVCNSDDGCPHDSEKVVPGPCGCGATEDDDDGDGVPNCDDLCPDVDDAVFAPQCVGQIPTVSQWGLVVMTILLLTAAKIYFSRKTGPAC